MVQKDENIYPLQKKLAKPCPSTLELWGNFGILLFFRLFLTWHQDVIIALEQQLELDMEQQTGSK